MGIITKGMGAIMKGAKKRKTLTLSFPTSKPKPPSRKGEVIIKKKSKHSSFPSSKIPGPRPSKTKLANTWQDRRVDAMNRKIRRKRGSVDKYIDEHGATSASKAPTKKVYKSIQKKWHGLTPDQKSEIYMKKAKRTPGNIHFDKKKFGKK